MAMMGNRLSREYLTLAASDASVEEQAKSALKDGKFPDGSKPIKVEKRIWRAQVKTQYIEPETEVDPSESLDFLYENAGRTVLKHKKDLPPRDDIISFSMQKHQECLYDLIQWRDCPVEHRPVIDAIIREYWDVFDPSGALRTIRGYIFNIDVGNHKPTCCKVPRYGPHESAVMNKLLAELEAKKVIEDDYGPYAAMIALAAKPNQEHKHWTEYIFRLCVSFRLLNAITRPFAFPIPRCDDEAEKMADAQYAITADLDCGYWQAGVYPKAREKTGFYTPNGKKHFCNLPMGIKNAAPFFVCMMLEMKKIWDFNFRETTEGIKLIEKAQELYGKIAKQAVDETLLKKAAEKLRNESKPDSSIIIDDLLLFAENPLMLIAYFMAVLQVLLHHRVAIKLRKTRFLPSRAEFVGMDLLREGNAPAKSKYGAIMKLKKPILFGDLRMLIGFFGFYSRWIPWYEERIGPWREVIKKKPPVDVSKDEEALLMANLWQPPQDALLEYMKSAILSGPVLKRPNWDREFYVKTDWSSNAKGGALCQPECTPEAEEAIMKALEDGSDEGFDRTLTGLRLRPLQFISQRNAEAERSYHSSVGELSAGRWAFNKWKHYLWYKHFKWETDCSGIIKFWDIDLMPTHQAQRWKVDMMRFDFTALHRSEYMMAEANLLSRYNQHANWLRQKEECEVRTRDAKIETRIQQGFSPNKGTRSLAAVTRRELMSAKAPKNSVFFGMINDFDRRLISYDDMPGFSNLATMCEGETVTRTFLAAICDKDRFMGCLTQTGQQLFETAKQELNMRSTMVLEAVSKNSWVTLTNKFSPTKLVKKLEERPDENQVDWMWMDIGKSQDEQVHETLVTMLRSNGCTVVILYWCRADRDYGETVKQWSAWCSEVLGGYCCSAHQVQNHVCGGPIKKTTNMILLLPERMNVHVGSFDDEEEMDMMEPYLDDPHMRYSDYIKEWSFSEDQQPVQEGECESEKRMWIHWQGEDHRVYSSQEVAPDAEAGDQFLVHVPETGIRWAIRPVRYSEIFRMYGFSEDFIREAVELSDESKRQVLATTIPAQSVSRIISVIQTAEYVTRDKELEAHGRDIGELGQRGDPKCHYYSLKNQGEAPFSYATDRVINRWTTFPLPTKEEWKEAIKADEDVAYLVDCIRNKKKVVLNKLRCRRYYQDWAKGQLLVEDDLLLQLEHPKGVRIRQLKRRVVPKGMRQLVYTAYHASPMAGHVGFFKTYWRIAARYYWPTMYDDIRRAVLECGHCILGNNVSHKAQQILGSLSVDEPFDIIAIDIWIPGVTLAKNALLPDRSEIKTASLTSVCNLTAFATVAYLPSMEGDVIAQVLMAQIVMPNGLPKLILLDEDSLFKQDLMVLLEDMSLPYHVVSAEQHEGILCERFHRYMNKAQRLIGLDTRDHASWMINQSFAAYAWNAAPVDGTDVVRSFAAKARTFHFPLDVAEPVERVVGSPGEATLQHIETTFPLWFKQKELLKMLTADRRERHLALANKDKTRREFNPGDLVVIRRQVKSNAAMGRPAKLQVKARGIYRVLEKAGDDSYWVQKIPVLPELNRRAGKRTKQAAWRLTRIPSSVIVHKRLDAADSRWLQRVSQLQDNPLERNLGFFDFGKYHKAAEGAKHAFEKVGEIMGFEIDDDDEDSDDEEEQHPKQDDSGDEPERSKNTADQGKIDTLVIETGDKVDTSCPKTTATLRKELATATLKSTDKLFLIKRRRPSHRLASWHLVQVDEEETDWRLAKTEGVYHVLFYLRCYADSKKKKVRECAYWPEIHEFKRDGETMGPIVPTKPAKVEHLLSTKPHRYMWYQDTINLFDMKITKPFDFEPGYRVPSGVWTTLLEEAGRHNIYVGNVNRIVQLDKPDREDKDARGYAFSHLAIRWNLLNGTE